MADEDTGPRDANTTVTMAFSPLLRQLRKEEWTSSLEPGEVDSGVTPPVVVAEPVLRASKPERGFVATRGTQVGKYLLEDKLGQGTFGSVYTARDTELERRVAFKVLNPSHQNNADVVTRFLQEARATARINHVGIVTILDVGRIATDFGDLAYIVMELLEGETLSRRIDRCARLQAPDAIEICHQIAGALGAAHKADVLHRDVKPDNIFLVRDPVLASGERVKVLDFGLAKLGRGGHTQTNTILGTPRYMSPEQTRSSASIDKRSDIYSLGVILFELLVGRRPFEGDLSTLIDRHQREIPARVKSIVPGVPKSLDDLVARMLAKQPGQRPQTMEDVQKELLTTNATHEVPQVGRSSVDQSLQRARAAVDAPAKVEAKPKKAKAVAKPVVETPKAPEPPAESLDELPKLQTVVAFPPPPPPDAMEPPSTAAEAMGNTLIVQPLALKRRRSLPMIAGAAFALAFVAVVAAVVIGRLAEPDRTAPVEKPATVPPQPTEPATPAQPSAAAPEKAEPAGVGEPEIIDDEPEKVEAAEPSRGAVKLRKRPPVRPPIKKKKPPPATPTWDPDALFPKKR